MAFTSSDPSSSRILPDVPLAGTASQRHSHYGSPQSASLVQRHFNSEEVDGATVCSALVTRADINTAAALRAQYAIETPKASRRRRKKKTPAQQPVNTTAMDTTESDSDAPVVDTTATIPLHSKKTTRQQRKHQRKIEQQLASAQNSSGSYSNSRATLLALPSELLTEIISLVLPSDIPSLHLTNHTIHNFLTSHEAILARGIIDRRYWTLHRCFPLPLTLSAVPEDAHAALLSPKRQEMLNIHRKSYHQHIRPIDPQELCTCMTCVFAWNNLCVIVDLAHWQGHLKRREPIPTIPRGQSPSWNEELLNRNADLVMQAITRPFVYAWIMEKHWTTITRTIIRHAKWRRTPVNSTDTSMSPYTATAGESGEMTGGGVAGIPIGPASILASQSSVSAPTRQRLFNLTSADIDRDTDEFLEREGPPSYEFPWMRDTYYDLEAYVPNRKWSEEHGKWFYYPSTPWLHERDLEWVRSWALGSGFRSG